MKNGKAVIFVDLDKTLAEHDEDYAPDKIGNPIKPMMDRVKRWIGEGKEVVIHTARVSQPGAFPHVQKWLRDQGLEGLRVTHKKSPEADAYYDDKAVAVEPNTGRILGGNTEHEQSWEDEAREAMK
jgi:nicotinamidase-related amidase